MALSQVIWALDDKVPLENTILKNEKELEDLLYEHIDILNTSWLVLGRQVQTSSGKYIDLLCMDQDGDMVVVELKKNMTPREVVAQAIDYASCVSKLSSNEIAEIFLENSNNSEALDVAYQKKFNRQLDDENVNEKVKMVIVASHMDESTERIIQYLRDTYQVDINILFFNVFKHGEKRLLSRVWFKEDIEDTREQITPKNEWNKEFYTAFGEGERHWEDARKLGFISAGGGTWYSNKLSMLGVDDRVWVNIPHVGYVGVGRVTETIKQAKDVVFSINGQLKSLSEIKTKGDYLYSSENPEKAEYIVKVEWQKAVSINEAVHELGFFGNQNIVCKPRTEKWNYTISRLKKCWNIE